MYEAPKEPTPPIVEPIVWTKETIDDEIERVAHKYKVSAELMRTTIQCESGGSTTIQSRHRRPDGSREESYGLVQIYLPAHPHVSKEQAIDPVFAIDFLASNLAKGKGHMWTCIREM